MNVQFDEVKGKLGFGCMRLPLQQDKQVDQKQVCAMVDRYLEAGFNYFDTAHGYLDGASEKALQACLCGRYPREAYLLTNKLSNGYFHSQRGIRPFFESQLKICGVEYFDFYLMHAQNRLFYAKYKACNAYETAFRLKEEGKIRHVGISFHDRANVLDKILSEYPQIEAVQIQLNYLDYYSSMVQGKECYEVCCKHGKPVIVMEPVKGGTLANLPDHARAIYAQLSTRSPASYAIRYAASFPNVFMVLSGMSTLEQMQDNLSYMRQFEPLNAAERKAVERVSACMRGLKVIPCTGCRYCTAGCPQHIAIPDWFAAANDQTLFGTSSVTPEGATPADCMACGACEKICPQSLPIRKLLKTLR